MRGMNRVGDGVEETVGWDNRRRLCSQSLSPRPDTQSHAHFLFKHDGVFVVSRSSIFKLIRNSRYRVLDSFWNSSLSSLSSSFTFNDILHSILTQPNSQHTNQLRLSRTSIMISSRASRQRSNF
ncbi:PREDICTED: uncharacterized protein LOC108694774 [Atta colombica]|uniref:uncharacterized protein LOC108694774 n=1 Tax=Atta colombica TaxID=520822 RepID=UPI00084C12FC|nr:PREDICTED: uncharacterized protein LOC108694774 [Atta colombica]